MRQPGAGHRRTTDAPLVVQSPDGVEYDLVSLDWDKVNGRYVLHTDWPDDDE